MPSPPFPSFINAPQYPEGHAWLGADVNKWILAGGLEWALIDGRSRGLRHPKSDDEIMSDVSAAYEKATTDIEGARAQYDKVIASFRSQVKNDLSSISAASDRVQAETAKIQRACHSAVSLMTSPEMISAIENAGRLATALKVISELESHSITFAVLDKKPVA